MSDGEEVAPEATDRKANEIVQKPMREVNLMREARSKRQLPPQSPNSKLTKRRLQTMKPPAHGKRYSRDMTPNAYSSSDKRKAGIVFSSELGMSMR
jgi:hypothetical protein